MTEQWHDLGAVEDFSEQSARNIAGVTVFFLNGTFYITETRCPHMGYPMSKGTIRNGIVTCAWHKWDFDLEHGGCYRGACDDLRIFPHKIENGHLWIDKQQSSQGEDWQRLLREAMMQGDRYLLAKIIARCITGGIALSEIVQVACQQAYEHAIRAHQSIQAVREVHALKVAERLCAYVDADAQVHVLLHAMSIASGPSGMRADVIPLPQNVDLDLIKERLEFYTHESSALGIERLLLSADLGQQSLQEHLLLLSSQSRFIHQAETFMVLSVCLAHHAELSHALLASEIAWVLGATRAQANADASEAMTYIASHQSKQVQLHSVKELRIEELATALEGNSVSAVLTVLDEWLDKGIGFLNIINVASQLCARRLARLSLNNGGLWRDAARGIRLCACMRSMHQAYPAVAAHEQLQMLMYYLFESRWLQHREQWNTNNEGTSDWDACKEAYENLDLKQCRTLVLVGYQEDKQRAVSEILSMLIKDDLNYELLTSIDAIISEAADNPEWYFYLSGLMTYAIDQRNSRNSLAAAEFGRSFV